MSDEFDYHKFVTDQLDKLNDWELGKHVRNYRCGSCSKWMTKSCTMEHGPTAPVPVVVCHMDMAVCKSYVPNHHQQIVNEYSVMRKLKP